MSRGFLFDLDGTLSDTDGVHQQMWKELLAPMGYECDSTFYKENISGRHNFELFKRFLPAGTSDEVIEEWGDKKESGFRVIAKEMKLLQPLAGLLDLVQQITQRDLKRACVTNACRKNAEFMLGELNLIDFFQELVIGEECDRPKPHPDPYLVGLEKLGVTAEESVVFEDSPSGILAAKRANVGLIIGVLTTQTPETLQEAGAHKVVRDFSEIDPAWFGWH